MFFHRCQQARGGGRQRTARSRRRRAGCWSVCFLLAPFAESVTGFGVGYIIALAALRRLGHRRHAGAAARPLQPVAGAVGRARHRHDRRRHPGRPDAQRARPRLGAAAGADPRRSTSASTGASRARRACRCRRRRRSTTRSGPRCCSALVWLANRYSDVEIAGAAPTAFLLAAALLARRAARRSRGLRAALRANAPYVALTLALCATRLVPPLRDLLKPLWAMKPVRQPAGLRAVLRAGLLAAVDRPRRRADRARAARPRRWPKPRAAPGAPAP